jgi:hypothetical protein
MGKHGQRLNTGTCFSVSSDDKLVLFIFPEIPTGDPAIVASVHASYDNISHLFPLLLIGHVVTYIVLIKGVILVSLENASFHMVYTINWFKKCQHINYCSHLKSDSTHHFFRNACTKSGSLRFSQFSGC